MESETFPRNGRPSPLIPSPRREGEEVEIGRAKVQGDPQLFRGHRVHPGSQARHGVSHPRSGSPADYSPLFIPGSVSFQLISTRPECRAHARFWCNNLWITRDRRLSYVASLLFSAANGVEGGGERGRACACVFVEFFNGHRGFLVIRI